MRYSFGGSLVAAAAVLIGLLLQACTVGPMREPTQTGLVLYTQGARQHTATVQLNVPPQDVYTAMLRVIRGRKDLKLISSNDRRYLIEVVQGANSITAQATPQDNYSTLLMVWAQAGKNGETGRDLALRAVNQLCTELAIECRMQDL